MHIAGNSGAHQVNNTGVAAQQLRSRRSHTLSSRRHQHQRPQAKAAICVTVGLPPSSVVLTSLAMSIFGHFVKFCASIVHERPADLQVTVVMGWRCKTALL